MHGANDSGDADDLVATTIDPVRFHEYGVFVKDFLRHVPAEGVVALPKNAL
jgi:hypothetical protein